MKIKDALQESFDDAIFEMMKFRHALRVRLAKEKGEQLEFDNVILETSKSLPENDK